MWQTIGYLRLWKSHWNWTNNDMWKLLWIACHPSNGYKNIPSFIFFQIKCILFELKLLRVWNWILIGRHSIHKFNYEDITIVAIYWIVSFNFGHLNRLFIICVQFKLELALKTIQILRVWWIHVDQLRLICLLGAYNFHSKLCCQHECVNFASTRGRESEIERENEHTQTKFLKLCALLLP